MRVGSTDVRGCAVASRTIWPPVPWQAERAGRAPAISSPAAARVASKVPAGAGATVKDRSSRLPSGGIARAWKLPRSKAKPKIARSSPKARRKCIPIESTPGRNGWLWDVGRLCAQSTILAPGPSCSRIHSTFSAIDRSRTSELVARSLIISTNCSRTRACWRARVQRRTPRARDAGFGVVVKDLDESRGAGRQGLPVGLREVEKYCPLGEDRQGARGRSQRSFRGPRRPRAGPPGRLSRHSVRTACRSRRNFTFRGWPGSAFPGPHPADHRQHLFGVPRSRSRGPPEPWQGRRGR